jgi:hypothetical protein
MRRHSLHRCKPSYGAGAESPASGMSGKGRGLTPGAARGIQYSVATSFYQFDRKPCLTHFRPLRHQPLAYPRDRHGFPLGARRGGNTTPVKLGHSQVDGKLGEHDAGAIDLYRAGVLSATPLTYSLRRDDSDIVLR